MKGKLIAALAIIKVLFLAWLVSGYVWTPAAATAATETNVKTAKADLSGSMADTVAPVGTMPDDVEKGLLEAIKRRSVELDAREEELKTRQDRLDALSRDIEGKVGELKKMLADNEALVKRLEEANSTRIKKTIKIYESMEPEEAAARLEKLTDSTAVLILSGMNPKKAGAVLGLVEVEKAVKLTQLLKLKKN